MVCDAAIESGITNAITVLQELLALVQAGSQYPKWHINPVAGNSIFYRTNVVNLGDDNTAVTVHINPEGDDGESATCRFVAVQFSPYSGQIQEE